MAAVAAVAEQLTVAIRIRFQAPAAADWLAKQETKGLSELARRNFSPMQGGKAGQGSILSCLPLWWFLLTAVLPAGARLCTQRVLLALLPAPVPVLRCERLVYSVCWFTG